MKTNKLLISLLFIVGLFVYPMPANNSYTEDSLNQISIEDSVNDPYSEGWAAGWCEGWKHVKGPYSYCPYTPYAPYPKYSCPEGYKCGYNRGFAYGMCMANEGTCTK